jgi:anti-sigma factor RsiW
MDNPCDEIRDLMSGYLDNELDQNKTERMEAHLEQCESCRTEFEEMTLLVSASSSLSVELPPDEVWDQFMLNVYNRTERQIGWIAFITGTFALLAWGIFEMIVLDWATPLVKSATGIALIGITILFISILRQRLAIRKSDRYSQHIRR